MRRWIFVAVGILVAVCISGFIAYNVAYGTGKAAGYEAGQGVGYNLGKQDGYNAGKDDGYKTGYNSGKADGYDEGLQAGLGHGYTLKDPTYSEAVMFIERDKTNGNKYIEDDYGVYVCSHFARDVCNNAEAQGFRCAFVELRFPKMLGHTIVAFNTIDQGLVYFEPQTDCRARPVIGQRWYQCQDVIPGYSGYAPPPFDDTIKDILVIW
jgi:hypothetical protein